ncbi:hypothetical protein LRS56_10615 [Pseudomonas poae]|nr:hypothetical protein LRS56_10615 [Pseudomonas poae]
MLPKSMRLWCVLAVVLSIFGFLLTGWRAFAGQVPVTDLVKPVVMGIIFTWAFFLSTKE